LYVALLRISRPRDLLMNTVKLPSTSLYGRCFPDHLILVMGNSMLRELLDVIRCFKKSHNSILFLLMLTLEI